MKVKLGALDATVHSRKAAEYGIQGYPTIKYFPAGKKISSSSAEEYNGGRTANDIVSWALERHTESLPPPDIKQVRKRPYFFVAPRNCVLNKREFSCSRLLTCQ